MARTAERVEGRLRQLEAIFRSDGFEFTEQDRGHLRKYLGNNDGSSRYEHLMDLDASHLAHSAAAFERESRRPMDDPRAPATLADAHRRLFQHADLRAGQRTGPELPERAAAAGANLRNLSAPKPFAAAAGEYYAAVSTALPYGRGSRVAAQLHIDREAQTAGHSVDWGTFHREHNVSSKQVLLTGVTGNQTGISQQAFSAAIYLRQFRTPQSQQAQRRTTQKSRTGKAMRRSGTLGRLKRGLGLGRRQERQDKDARGGQRAR
jgi:fido (protein-threonine AMPylation protein)